MYYLIVISRLYVHNFRCLENFDLPVFKKPSTLLVGKNGAGKTTVGVALEILQKVARGTNRVGELVKPSDFARGRSDVPMRFEIEVELSRAKYAYVLALEFPQGFKELRVMEEKLSVDGKPVYSRQLAQVSLPKTKLGSEAKFSIDWHLVALPIIQQQSDKDPIFVFKQWLGRMLILRPMPSLFAGESRDETLQPNLEVTNFGSWFSGIIAHAPASYGTLDRYLKEVMPDMKDIKNPIVGADSRRLMVQFSNDLGNLSLPLEALSDGEKCFMVCALVLASNESYGPLLCFWDEPDNYLALSEVSQFVLALRRAFQYGGQFIATSHNPEAIRRFSEENTLLLARKSHLEPSTIRLLSELQIKGDLVGVLTRDDVPV